MEWWERVIKKDDAIVSYRLFMFAFINTRCRINKISYKSFKKQCSVLDKARIREEKRGERVK